MNSFKENRFSQQKTSLIILIPITIAIFLFAYFSIKESRADSLKLLVIQGEAFIESLSSATKNAISSEKFYERLAHKRYNEITIDIEQYELNLLTNENLFRLSLMHNLYSAHVFDIDAQLKASSFARGSQLSLPSFVIDEVKYLLSNKEDNYLLLLDDDEKSGEVRHYYIKLSNKMDRVTVVVADAIYFVDALKQTQIGYLARQMASENSIEYIIYQATDGIVFSSFEIDNLLAINSDKFLLDAIESDTIMHRRYIMQDTELLEIVRPFSTSDYPFGLLRIGLSLDDYNQISKRFDWLMILFSAGLLLLLVVSIIYINSREKQKTITAEYDQFKSVSDKIFDEMNTGVAAVDINGKIIVINRAFENIIGIQNASNQSWDNVIAPLFPSLSTLQENNTNIIEKEISFTNNETHKILLIVLSSLSKNHADDNSFVAVINDITTLRKLEQKTARKERLSEMGDLAAGVAHEIRNPLNTISIASQRLAAEFSPSENKEEYLSFTNQIKDETKRLNNIITQFLALARGENKQNVKIDLTNLVVEFTQFIKAEANKLAIEIQANIDTQCFIKADSDKVKQVLANLYNNAKEAIEDNKGVIKISLNKSENFVELVFEDSGIGIPKDIRDKIFTPYYTTKEAGTGLGLPTVHRIITDLNGEIRVSESDIGGAMFVIKFN